MAAGGTDQLNMLNDGKTGEEWSEIQDLSDKVLELEDELTKEREAAAQLRQKLTQARVRPDQPPVRPPAQDGLAIAMTQLAVALLDQARWQSNLQPQCLQTDLHIDATDYRVNQTSWCPTTHQTVHKPRQRSRPKFGHQNRPGSQPKNQKRTPGPCYNCQGMHWHRDCPRSTTGLYSRRLTGLPRPHGSQKAPLDLDSNQKVCHGKWTITLDRRYQSQTLTLNHWISKTKMPVPSLTQMSYSRAALISRLWIQVRSTFTLLRIVQPPRNMIPSDH